MSQIKSPKAVLRLLLRAVDRHITAVADNQQWRQHVLQQFRQGRDVDAAQQQRLLLLAQEYADLVNNIAHHQSLLDTYNIGVDPDARNKQMVEKTAARVGFKLPVEQQADQLSASLQPQQPQQPQELEQLEQVQAQHSHQPSAEQPHSASEAAAPTNSSSSIRQQPGLHVDPPASAAIAAAAAAVAAA